MRRTTSFVIIIAAVILLLAGAIAFAPKRESASGDVVAVTSYPLKDVVSSVAGAGIRVVTVMPPGGNPHTFEPTPTTVRTLGEAKVVYAIGHGFDDWIDMLLADAGTEKVTIDRGIALRESAHHEEEREEGAREEDEHGPVDPHYWLVARNMIEVARTVAADLSVRFPERRAEITANLTVTTARLAATDADVSRLLADLPRKEIVTLHDAWYYFADAYGLTVTGSFEPSAGREPTPKAIADLSRALRAAGTSVIYKEPGLPTAGLESFAADNDLRIVALDTVEGASADPYDVIMIRNASIIRENQQ